MTPNPFKYGFCDGLFGREKSDINFTIERKSNAINTHI